ncbi:MAG: aldo/keto reductase [Phycisphaeraceae bacterium]|nr:aldo/keto reductase [Phycisphaeraceae bacterium]
MKWKLIGDTGVMVSPLCFGTSTFGSDSDEQNSAMIYARCREVGINFFDCGNVYSQGRSEIFLGKLIRNERDKVIITSKVTHGPRDQAFGHDRYGSSRAQIMHHIERSLQRLNTDYLDFYFLHNYDAATTQEDSMRAMDDLVRAGKVRYPAISNHAAWQIMKAISICQHEGWWMPRLLQPMYSLIKRQAESEIFPLAQSEKLGVITSSPLAGGILTGKYGPMSNLDAAKEGRMKDNQTMRRRYPDEQQYEAATQLVQVARQNDTHPATLAIVWVMANPAVTCPIIGARNLEQLAPALAALDFVMSDELYQELSSLTPAPALATDREDERALQT